MPLQFLHQSLFQCQADAVVFPEEATASAAFFDAPAPQAARRLVLQTPVPHWQDGAHGETAQLRQCYTEGLRLVAAQGCESVALPLLGGGTNGFPKELILPAAVEAVSSFLEQTDLLVLLAMEDPQAFFVALPLLRGVQRALQQRPFPAPKHKAKAAFPFFAQKEPVEALRTPEIAESCISPAAQKDTLEQALQTRDESFSQMLFRLLDEYGIKDADCYKKANLDRKLFSKIRSNPAYRPRKTTALALAVALKLSLPQTKELLMKAGLALNRTDTFDIIVAYCIEHGVYDIFEINALLFQYDQPLLGSF